jgi:hypothetical protein
MKDASAASTLTSHASRHEARCLCDTVGSNYDDGVVSHASAMWRRSISSDCRLLEGGGGGGVAGIAANNCTRST